MAKKKNPLVKRRTSEIEQLAESSVQQESANPLPAEAALAEGFRFREAYRVSTAAREAIQPAELLRLSFDVTLAVNIALAAAQRLEEFKEAIAGLPLEHELIAQLNTYAHAVGYAQALYSVASVSEELQIVYADALARRVTLRSDAVNLATHGLVNQDKVFAIKGDVGYRNVGYELLSLISIMREAGPRVAGRTATLPADLDRAELVATELLELAALKEQRQQGDPRAAEDRLRAISLLVKSYDQARRAIYFLRWNHGDADKITPSIYTARSLKRRNVELEVEVDVQVPGALPTPNSPPASVNPPMSVPQATAPPAGSVEVTRSG